MTSTPRTRALSAAAWLAAAALPGCGTQCETHPAEPPVRFGGGRVDAARGIYDSAPGGVYLAFPPGRTYRFEHGLGGRPALVQTWLAFSRTPVRADGGHGSGTVPGAGNQVTVETVTDRYVDVRNDTCSDVYVRVDLGAPERVGAPADAGPG